ncbi:MAG: phage integrase N-terminal SAM-like domain-containing protein [Synechococcaceae cyanobacterium]
MGSAEVNAFLTHLAVEGHVSASTQNKALSALLLRLRVHDLDVQRLQITVRDGKGGKDRRTMLPARVAEKLQARLQEVQRLHRQDLADGYGRVRLPHALGRKYPHAPVEWGWQWVFPQQHR